MTKKLFLSASAVLILVLSASADAQQSAKIPRIGILVTNSPSTIAARIDAFLQGLRELGYVEGKNIVVEFRSGEGKLDRLPALAAELVRLNVDVILAAGPADTRTVKGATSTIPIVMGFDPDPVGSGFVATLARPGGNITGLSTLAPELSGKRLELVQETVRKLSRVVALGDSTVPGNAQTLRELELAAKTFRVKLQYLDVFNFKDVGKAFQAAIKGHADAVVVLSSPVLNSHRKQVAEVASKSRLPAIHHLPNSSKMAGL
jgi:putative ABC transport system substrate-binding protein